MESRIALFPRYVKTFGFISGALTFLFVEVLQRSKVNVPGVSAPVHLRKGTSDLKVFREVFLFRSYLIDIEPPATILDGGANIGLGSIYFANRYPLALIISIEPDEGNFLILKKNAEPYPNIKVVKSALWPTNTHLKIQDTRDSEWAFQVTEADADDAGAFVARSISEIMNEYGISKLGLLKLDVEGSEYDLFKSHYEDWIERVKHVVVEFHDWAKPGSSRAVFATIAQYPFTTTILNGMLMFSRTD